MRPTKLLAHGSHTYWGDRINKSPPAHGAAPTRSNTLRYLLSRRRNWSAQLRASCLRKGMHGCASAGAQHRRTRRWRRRSHRDSRSCLRPLEPHLQRRPWDLRSAADPDSVFGAMSDVSHRGQDQSTITPSHVRRATCMIRL